MSISNEDLARAYQRGQLAALGALWMQVKQLAWWMVSRFLSLAKSNKAVDSDDLMQAAFLGVERAAKAFNPELGSFATIMGYYLYDNAVAESTFRMIKAEFIAGRRFDSLEQLRLELADYVHWFNHIRLHSTLGYRTPVEFRNACTL